MDEERDAAVADHGSFPEAEEVGDADGDPRVFAFLVGDFCGLSVRDGHAFRAACV